MNFSYFIIIFIFISSNIFGQNNHPYQNGEKVLNEKIEKYYAIDTLNSYSPIKAIQQGKVLDYEVSLIEGEISISNKEKKRYGTGGFSIYKFVNKNTKNVLKIEYKQTKHIYKDTELKNYINSEIQRVIIFFNNDNIPDLAKIYENQYTSDEVLSSEIYYLNLSKSENYYKSTETNSLMKYIQTIISNYK